MKEMILKMAQELGEDLLVWEWEFTDSVRISIDVNNFEGFDKNYHEIMREYDEEKVGAFYNSKGAERSIIGIYGVTAPGNLYIDNLRITQNYKTGEQFSDPFFMDFLYPDTQIEITIPERGAECDIWHKVSAVKVQVGSDGINQVLNYKSSAYTPLQYVGKAPQSGIETTTLALLPSARVNAGMLNVANPAGQTVNIFDLSGRLIASDASGAAALSIALPDAGIYVVKVGNTAIKVIR